MNNRKFKKGELSKDAYNIIMYDLQCLDLRADLKNNEYHYKLLVSNLKDIFGVRK